MEIACRSNTVHQWAAVNTPGWRHTAAGLEGASKEQKSNEKKCSLESRASVLCDKWRKRKTSAQPKTGSGAGVCKSCQNPPRPRRVSSPTSIRFLLWIVFLRLFGGEMDDISTVALQHKTLLLINSAIKQLFCLLWQKLLCASDRSLKSRKDDILYSSSLQFLWGSSEVLHLTNHWCSIQICGSSALS